jgi:N-acetylmuramoyl-L-alanine amidase
VRFKRLLFILCMLVSMAAIGGNGVEVKTVVIDAGHGGKDPGTSGPGKTNEKDVALAVALKLGELIKKNFPDVNIIYTRKTDVFVELHERAEMANKAKADLFIAVHCNSNPNQQIYGTSSYVLGLHRTEANLEVAKRENAVILMESDHDKNYEFDPNSPEGNIIMSMKQNAFLDQSINIASKLESEYESNAKRKSLGVKQAGFYVLYKTTMPSILSEIGFLSNPEEEKFLASAKGQELIATSLLKAFKDYKYEMENRQTEAPVADAGKTELPAKTSEPGNLTPAIKKDTIGNHASPATDNNAGADAVTTLSGRRIRKPIENASGGGIAAVEESTAPPATTAKPTVINNAPAPKKDTVTPVSTSQPAGKPVTGNNPPVQPKKDTITNVVQPLVDDKPLAETKIVVKPVTDNKAPTATKKEPVVKEENSVTGNKPANKPVVTETKTEKTSGNNSETSRGAGIQPRTNESGIVFMVQLFAIKGEPKKSEYDKITRLFNVISTETLDGGTIRYIAGDEKHYSSAQKIQEKAIAAGYKDAFIVGYNEGKRMSPSQLKAAEGK